MAIKEGSRRSEVVREDDWLMGTKKSQMESERSRPSARRILDVETNLEYNVVGKRSYPPLFKALRFAIDW